MIFCAVIRRWTPSVIVLACAFAALNLWLGPGIIQTHAGGDSPFLLQRVYELTANLKAGVFPARWMPDAAYGLGYPFFNFYASLPYYIASVLNLSGFDLLTAIKLTQTAGMFAAAATMWLYARRLLPRSGVTITTVAYTLAPYHLVNLYVRGDSLQEFYAFVWYPLILWAVDRVVASTVLHEQVQSQRAHSRDTIRQILILGLALSGLVLTHNVSALIFAPIIVIYALGRLFVATRRKGMMAGVKGASWLVCAALMALILSAWFWLPALGEAGLVQLNNQTTGYFDYNNHFRTLNLVQLQPLFDYRVDGHLDVFAMALPQALLVLVGGGFWLARKRRRDAFWLSAGLFAVSTFMMTPFSKPIWATLPGLALTQFPWRFLSIQSLFAALVIGGVSHAMHGFSEGYRKFRLVSIVTQALILLLLCLSLPGIPNERLDIRAEDVTVKNLQLYEWLSGNIGTTIRAEYLPNTIQPRPVTGPDLQQQQRRAIAVAGTVSTSTLTLSEPNRQIWQLVVDSETATVTLPVLYWPGWQAQARENTQASSVKVDLSPYVGSGWVQFSLSKGTYQVELTLSGTQLEHTAEGISLVGVLLALALIVLQLRLGTEPRFRILKPIVLIGLITVGVIIAGQLARMIYQPVVAPLQTLDYGDRQFVHRSPIAYRSETGDVMVLTGATISPAKVQAGGMFTLTTTWRDGYAPAQIGIEQELPSGGYFARLFYFGRSVSSGSPEVSQHIVISDALPGQLLLKLLVRDDNGRIYTPTSQTGQTLDHQLLTGLTVIAPVENALSVGDPVRVFPNGIRLRYADWYQPTYNDVCFRTTWDSVQPIADALQIAYVLKGADGRVIARADTQPQAGLAPTWSWPTGAPVSDGYCVPTTDRLNPGESYTYGMRWYRLFDQHSVGEVTLVGAREQETVWTPNKPRPIITNHSFTLTDMQHTSQVIFDEHIRLKGFAIETTTQSIRLSLFWSSITTLTMDYKQFVHLAPMATAEPIRQVDRLSRDGMYPTGMWQQGEIVTDVVTLDTSGVAPGAYQLAVGWYDPDTLRRLPATDETEPIRDGRLILADITR